MNNPHPATLARLMGLMCEAIALRAAGQLPQAVDALDQALALDAGFIPAHMQRADLLAQAGRHADAVAACEACLEIAPDFADARIVHAQLLAQLAAQCESELADGAAADSFPLQFTLAQARYKSGQMRQALVAVEAALASGAAGPLHFPARALRADILLRLNRHEEALASYGDVAGLDDEQRALASHNRADILRQMGQVGPAQEGYGEALRQCPDLHQARVGRAHMLLMRGDFEEGWREHEARHHIPELAARRVRSAQPPWRRGDDLRGRHVLLWAEQGLGDTLQFARYIPLVAALAARVTVCVPPGLLSLLAQSFPGCDFVVNDKAPPLHDLYASLLSLPWLLALPEPGQAPSSPYLQADDQAVADWRARLDAMTASAPRRPRIGIAWAGRQYATIHYSRDIALEQLAPLFALPADFISLQPVVPAGDADARAALGERLHAPPLQDWADTAALIQGLDLVISVDTAVAHLAGALRRPCLLMLRYEGEWRWGLAPQHTAWYPGTRLYRQQRRGEWDAVVEQVTAACLAPLSVAP
ncbi:glycosyltransferase family protein [Herbaspirillum sp. LeCh32-8]|uniref:tetratricopeptide repeat-containing glycosyltransferase family protein n=1 Tax=Herbaspirillum sp. LeCh32-8 TaxID=2821356 RepID=UPI001AE7AB1C|nr:tetratricopeptide repeat-containing glycosyltransferase family protein [Herbaspirillum sp. LeCh32-8]MBP0597131.1 glycosyltransferase family protein [Herbaspirillum sp. LeCh32-8]